MKKTYSEIGRTIMSYDKHFKIFMKKELAPLKLNVAEAMVMMALYEKDGQTQEQLLSVLHYDKSVMTRTIQSLETAGRIDRCQNPEDARSWVLMVSQEGLQIKEDILGVLKAWCKKAFAGIPASQTEVLLNIMHTVIKNIDSEA